MLVSVYIELCIYASSFYENTICKSMFQQIYVSRFISIFASSRLNEVSSGEQLACCRLHRPRF